MRRIFLYTILVSIWLFSSCGKKGPIYPPVEKIPKNVEGFNIVQQGDAIVTRWRNPTAYIDGSPMPNLSGVEIWIFEEEKEAEVEFAPLNPEAFVTGAEVLVQIPSEKFSGYLESKEGSSPDMRFYHRYRLGDFGNRRLTLGMKVKDDRGRFTDFSELRSIVLEVVVLPPDNLRAVVHKDNIELNWNPPSQNVDQSQPPILCGYNVYRSSGDGQAVRINPLLLSESRYQDMNFVFGNLYRYFIRSSSSDASPYLESQDSETLDILAKDTFPPDPPTGLVAIAGESTIALSWDPNQENDLAGYKILRRMHETDEFVELIPEGVQESSFSDADVKEGMMYEYAVVAVDKYGNISNRSNSVEAIFKGGMNEDLPF